MKRSSSAGHELADSPWHVLVVANRTAATLDLAAAVRRYADQRPTAFDLLIPAVAGAEHPDWTLECALSLLERAARGRVAALTSGQRDPFAAVRDVVASRVYDRIIVSTPPSRSARWLRRDLPRRVESLGVPIETIGPRRGTLSDVTGPPMMSGCELWLKAGAFTKRRAP